MFRVKQKLKAFLTSRPALKEILKEGKWWGEMETTVLEQQLKKKKKENTKESSG